MPRWRILILLAFAALLAACAAPPQSGTPTYTLLPTATRTALPSATATPTEIRQPAPLPRVTNTPRPTATPSATLPPWTPSAYTPPTAHPLALSPANAGQMQELAVLGNGSVNQVIWSPDRRTLVVASVLGLDIYDALTWQRLARYPVVADLVSYAPSGEFLLVVSGHRLQWLDPATGAIWQTQSTASGDLRQVVFSPGGTWLALFGFDFYGSGDPQHFLEVFNAATGELLHTHSDYSGSFGGIAFSPDGRTLALTTGAETRLFDADTGDELAFYNNLGGAWVEFTPDGAALVLYDWPGDGRHIVTLATGQIAEATPEPISPPSTPDIWLDSAGRLIVTDLTTHAVLAPLPYTPGLTALAFGPLTAAGALTVLAGDQYGRSWSWDLSTSEALTLTVGGYDYNGTLGAVTGITYASDEQLLLTSYTAGFVRATLPALGIVLFGLDCFTSTSNEVRLAQAGDSVAAACDDPASVLVWNTANGEQMGQLPGGYADVVEWRGQWFGVVLAAGHLELRAVPGGATARTLAMPAYFGTLSFMVASPSGRWLAGGTDDADIFIWDAATAELAADLVGHEGTVNEGYRAGIVALRFSLNTDLLASVGVDGTVRLWDPATGTELRRFDFSGVTDIAFSADGRYLAASSSDGLVRVWGLPSP